MSCPLKYTDLSVLERLPMHSLLSICTTFIGIYLGFVDIEFNDRVIELCVIVHFLLIKRSIVQYQCRMHIITHDEFY